MWFARLKISRRIVKIIMKSVWLRDALSEIDTSCEFITIICNPPQKITRADNAGLGEIANSFFRIEAKSMRGNVEVSGKHGSCY
jgi:cell cycle checkpoint protein